ncbi:MAG: xanthine dehydrogenase large subunit [Kiritimatiellia bacterium]|jgi:xanthine dehydrogenase large subunit
MSRSPLHRDTHHRSAILHVTGDANYVDDLPEPRGTLVADLLTSPHPHARITSTDSATALAIPGVHGIYFADDVPGHNQIGAISHDEPVLAEGEVHCVGQAVALIIADSRALCRAAAAAIQIEYEVLPAILTIERAVEADAWLGNTHIIERGNPSAASKHATVHIDGTIESPGQDHFYLEGQVAMSVPGEHGSLQIYSSTQHPSEVQTDIASFLDIGRHHVVVQSPRMGGAFGGKESQASNLAVLCALGSYMLGHPIKMRFDREQDMVRTGKRHPFQSHFKAGFNDRGDLMYLEVETIADGGWITDLSPAILDRALFHLDSAYYVPELRFVGRIARTNTVSNTAFRGFGGPQGVIVIEQVMSLAAERLGIDPIALRQRNFYGAFPRDQTPYGQRVTNNHLARITDRLLDSSKYTQRRLDIGAWNARQPYIKRGLGFQPVKFGISFTNSLLNQAGALVHLYTDGTAQLNHGGTEMGQGLHTKMRTVAAHNLGLLPDDIRVMHTSTDKVPNTVATAASSGSDLNGQAVKVACLKLQDRLSPVAHELLGVSSGIALTWVAGIVHVTGKPDTAIPIKDVASAAWAQKISLSATGYYSTPGIGYDHAIGRGKPFHYYAYGAAITEVEINTLTGESRMLRVDILHDAGNPLVPSIDIGQIEGAFVQGVGWLSTEELVWRDGRLLTHGPSTYKIPSAGDVAADFRVELLDDAEEDDVIHGSKAVGEPPFVLGISFVWAIRHAISSLGTGTVELSLPCTTEAILRSVQKQRG